MYALMCLKSDVYITTFLSYLSRLFSMCLKENRFLEILMKIELRTIQTILCDFNLAGIQTDTCTRSLCLFHRHIFPPFQLVLKKNQDTRVRASLQSVFIPTVHKSTFWYSSLTSVSVADRAKETQVWSLMRDIIIKQR